ncbi:MAG: PilW family protein [Acidimicrobiales bacterium]
MRFTGARKEHGFGMIELVVAMGLSVGILTVATSFFTSGWQHTANLEREIITQGDARVVIAQMADELRQAYTGQAGLAPIESLSSTAITFYSPNREAPFKLRKIIYQHSGTTLTRSEVLSTNTATPWSIPGGAPTAVTVLSNVLPPGGVVPSIFTGTGAPTRTVAIQVSIDSDTTKLPAAQKYEVTAYVRVTPT